MGHRKRILILIAAVALTLAAIPAIVLAAGGTFIDDDTSMFEADIEWLANADVTKGCNPPTNDHFCPDDNVTRGQMAAFMRRFAQFLGAEDGIVSQADTAATADNATNATNADLLDGYDSSYYTGNDGFSVWNNGPIDIPTSATTLLALPDLPAGSYLFIAKGWFRNAGSGGEQAAECALSAGTDTDHQVATLAEANHGIPVTWTVVHTFTAPTNSAALVCSDHGFDVTLNDAKITGIRLDSMRNEAG